MQASTTEVQSILGNVKYPATKNQVISEARKQNISGDTMQALENIPDREYNSAGDVVNEFESFQKAVEVFHNRKYPATKQELVNEARNLHVRDVIIRALEACPDKEYSSPADVIKECRANLQIR
jgi:chromatin segregation and condensation protein Rec8/ScpA/Scc1 (kleisin family)